MIKFHILLAIYAVHEVLMASILGWFAIPFSSGSGGTEECANHWTVALIFPASKVMLKILPARLQHYGNQELPDVQAGLQKEEEPEIKLPTFVGSSKKQESSRKNIYFCFLTMPKPLTVWVTTNCGKF